jgi:hypothetical protein
VIVYAIARSRYYAFISRSYLIVTRIYKIRTPSSIDGFVFCPFYSNKKFDISLSSPRLGSNPFNVGNRPTIIYRLLGNRLALATSFARKSDRVVESSLILDSVRHAIAALNTRCMS